MAQENKKITYDSQINSNLRAINRVCSNCPFVNIEQPFKPCNSHGIGWIKRQADGNKICPDNPNS